MMQTFPKGLGAQLCGRIDQDGLIGGLDHDTGPPTIIARVFRMADGTRTANDRDAIRGTCAEKGDAGHVAPVAKRV